ncbi:MAG: MG2 domain-containing protein [Terracidiphilus sp.]
MSVRCAWLIPFLAILISPNLLPQDDRRQSVTVDESKIQFHLFPDLGVDFPLTNQADHPLQGALVIEILDEDSNSVVDQADKDFQIAPGTVTESLSLAQKPVYQSPLGLGGHRLRYTITLQASGELVPIQGIIQLGPHIVDGFGIQGYPRSHFHCGLDCGFLVRVADPNSGRGLADYEVEAEFYQGSKTVIHATTDKDGYAEIRYNLPIDRVDQDGSFEVTVSRGYYKTAWGGLFFRRAPPHLTLTTDKTAYHPGETVHAHLLLLGTDRKPWASSNVTLKFTNVFKEQELLQKKIVTSPTGEASEDWTIPEDTRDGTISILVTSNDEPQGNWTAQSKVKIRVEKEVKPTFVLNAVLDHQYYLPGQIAKLTVTGLDLFGKPIHDGKVMTKTGWYPEVESQGKLDDSGEFVAQIDLNKMSDQFKELLEQGRPGPHFYEFPVYVSLTESSTGSTESRHVALRLTPQEIHLRTGEGGSEGSKKTFSIVSSYVDKLPASVDGVVEAAIPAANERCPAQPEKAQRISLGSFHTNSYGVAQFTLPQSWIHYAYPQREDGPYSWYARTHKWDAPNERASKYACILLRASDGKGKTGSLYQEVWVVRETHFGTRFSTDHSIYRPGDPIHVSIESDEGLAETLVEIRTPEGELLGAQHLQLSNGSAHMTFPYNAKFQGLLFVHVYAITGKDDPNPVDSWSREVIYPTGAGQKDGERWPTEMWDPDRVEPDNPRFAVTSGEDDRGRIAGFEKTDLLRLDPARPFPEGLDLVAWALLDSQQSWGGWWVGYYTFRHEKFDKENLATMERALRKLYTQNPQTARYPKTEGDLREDLKKGGVDFSSECDGWGMPYRVVFDPKTRTLEFVSSGPDKLANTSDDYLAGKINWP